jgi:hypothetical protein
LKYVGKLMKENPLLGIEIYRSYIFKMEIYRAQQIRCK